jgi:hypothetical protein
MHIRTEKWLDRIEECHLDMTGHLSSLRLVLSFLKGLSAWQHMLSPATIKYRAHIYLFFTRLSCKVKKKKR